MARIKRGHGEKLYPTMRAQYMSGLSLTEIGEKHGVSRYSVHRILARYTPPEQWPLPRHPVVTHQTRSRRALHAAKSVDPGIIMELVQEYLDENDLVMADFTEKLGLQRHSCSILYKYRSGTKKTMSGAMAARILKAIGEPVRKDLVA